MIRRDYILRMIEEFFQFLSRLKALKREQLWKEAGASIEDQLRQLFDINSTEAARLSETELFAKVIQGEPTQAVHEKALILTTLLKEAGDVDAAQGRLEESQACYLKGLHLLLNLLARDETGESPEFVPKVEVFLLALEGMPLPLPTQALLMAHYERIGQFARAEDSFYAMLETDPTNRRLLEFGIRFYQRIEAQSDTSLSAGNLPRPELEAGLAELRTKCSEGK